MTAKSTGAGGGSRIGCGEPWAICSRDRIDELKSVSVNALLRCVRAKPCWASARQTAESMLQGRCSIPRALKVYQAQIGFYDLIVAAPSQAAALRAWGIHLNMFADGSARVATDEQAIKAALAQPEVPLKRGVGTNDPFSLNPGLPRFADLPPAGKKATAKRQPAASKPKPPDRSALNDAEAALQGISDERRIQESSYAKQYAELNAEEEQLRKRRAATEAEEVATKRHLDAATLKAEMAVRRERQAFTRAGGDPRAN